MECFVSFIDLLHLIDNSPNLVYTKTKSAEYFPFGLVAVDYDRLGCAPYPWGFFIVLTPLG
jgi:hypothetical protein